MVSFPPLVFIPEPTPPARLSGDDRHSPHQALCSGLSLRPVAPRGLASSSSSSSSSSLSLSSLARFLTASERCLMGLLESPSRPLHLMVPSAPCGAADALACHSQCPQCPRPLCHAGLWTPSLTRRAADTLARHSQRPQCPRPLRHVGLQMPSLAVGQEGISAERRGAAEHDCCLSTTTARSPAPCGAADTLACHRTGRHQRRTQGSRGA